MLVAHETSNQIAIATKYNNNTNTKAKLGKRPMDRPILYWSHLYHALDQINIDNATLLDLKRSLITTMNLEPRPPRPEIYSNSKRRLKKLSDARVVGIGVLWLLIPRSSVTLAGGRNLRHDNSYSMTMADP